MIRLSFCLSLLLSMNAFAKSGVIYKKDSKDIYYEPISSVALDTAPWFSADVVITTQSGYKFRVKKETDENAKDLQRRIENGEWIDASACQKGEYLSAADYIKIKQKYFPNNDDYNQAIVKVVFKCEDDEDATVDPKDKSKDTKLKLTPYGSSEFFYTRIYRSHTRNTP